MSGHKDRRTRGQSHGMGVAGEGPDNFATMGADEHRPPLRFSHAVAQQAARRASEAHVILRHRGWRDHGPQASSKAAQEGHRKGGGGAWIIDGGRDSSATSSKHCAAQGHTLYNAKLLGEGHTATASRINSSSKCVAFFFVGSSAFCKACLWCLVAAHRDVSHWTISDKRRPPLREATWDERFKGPQP